MNSKKQLTGTRDFGFDAAEMLAESRTPFFLCLAEPGSNKVNLMTTFSTKDQCLATIDAIQAFMEDKFGPDWGPSEASV